MTDAPKDEKPPTAKEIVEKSVGVVGGLEVLDLFRRLRNGGLEKMSKLLMATQGWKTYVAGVGLIGQGVSDVSQGHWHAGVLEVAGGLGTIGFRHVAERMIEALTKLSAAIER